MTDDQTSELLSDLLAGTVAEVARQHAREELLQLVARLKGTLFFTALCMELGDTSETTVDAARRLHASERVLRRHRERIRELLSERCPPLCDNAGDEIL